MTISQKKMRNISEIREIKKFRWEPYSQGIFWDISRFHKYLLKAGREPKEK